MIVTKGEPYLKISEDKMSFIMHNSSGVYAIIAACIVLPVMIARALLALLLRGCKPFRLQLKNAVRGCLPVRGRAHQA